MKELRRQNATINNLGLREVDAHIINVRAIEPEAQVDMSYAARPTRPGQVLLKRQRRSKKIQIQFMIRELYDLAERNAILDAVNAWAQDGVLQISTRPNQMAQVIVTKYASPADIRNYTDAYTVEFEACGVPYWQDQTPATLELSGGTTATGGQIVTNGNVISVADAVITPTGGTLTGFTAQSFSEAGMLSDIGINGMSVAAGTPVVFSHDARGILRIESGGQSMLGYRSSTSSDELLVTPHYCIINCIANTAFDVVFSARGWYR